MQRGEVLHRDAAVWCALPCYVFQYLGHHRLCSVASWALWRFVFRCPVAVRSMSLSDVFPFGRKSVPNRLKQMLWAICGNPSWATIRDRECSKSVPMQRGARFVFCRSVLMQRGAHFSILGLPLGGPTWTQ